jgi:branched-chain amino acid transport system ATP-binding protein
MSRLLEVRSASRRFGTLAALDGVSLAVEAGELRAIIGPNGAGKTTFFNLVSGFFRPDSGTILFDGRAINAVSVARRVKLGIARTFQITEIFPELSVRENLRIAVEVEAGLHLRPWLARKAAANLQARTAELMDLGGVAALADRTVGELAHGDQRATEIMLALALKPRLLLLDEPTAGMGDQETYHITELVRRLHTQGGLTVILIEHDMRVVFRLASRITVLAEGRVLAEGTSDDIVANEAVQAAYLGKAA